MSHSLEQTVTPLSAKPAKSHTVAGVPATTSAAMILLNADAPLTSAYPHGYAPAKRILDALGSGIGLLLLFPVFAAIAFLIAVDSPGPILHRRRVLAKQPFTPGDVPQTFDAFKFRTMIPDADDWLIRNPALFAQYQVEFKLTDDPRITKIGRWLRRTSLDELPQLINVLCGQMSLVGPRMITPAELRHYAPFESKLMAVLPGLTGFWQVSGRSNVSYPERVRLDMWYIDNRSLRLDLEILWRTVGTVLLRRGAQ